MNTAHLETLQQELNNSTPEKRTKLLHFVSNIYQQRSTSLAEQHIHLLADIAGTLIEDVDLFTLCEAADIFAHLDRTPHSLIRKLAHQRIEVAATVIENSIVLTDSDLVEIIQTNGSEHLSHILKRDTLSSRVTDFLIEDSDQVTLETLVKKTGAFFSENGFIQLTEMSINNDEIAKALIVRPDIPYEIANQLLENHDLMGSGKLMEKGEKLRIKFGSQALNAHKMRNQRALFLPLAKTHISQIENGETTLNASLIELSTQGNVQALCQVISAFAQTPEGVITEAFFNVSGTHIIQISIKLNLSRDAFLAIITLRTKRRNLPNSQIFYLMQQFDSLP